MTLHRSRRNRFNRLILIFGMFVCMTGSTTLSDVSPTTETLRLDGRLGTITDAQGIVSLQPAMGKRWTPVCRRTILKPKDWVRTRARRANAAFIDLLDQGQITLGPGALVELVASDSIRIVEGEVAFDLNEDAKVTVQGAGQNLVVAAHAVVRVNQERRSLEKLTEDPKWLTSLTGDAKQDPLGSLIADIDGRDVPLTVGYHKVTVDIRDQIARTTIEESFVNHTNSRTEGVFYFPLPQDASISGFGMWIGGELVEADIVEKQRAREIYETILREKRDPGLLEWQGGNLFKARVFPIEAHSEKRIKITYTQVLPREGNRFRYSYALQSELLKQHPLRELKIDVRVHSAVGIRSAKCLTHTAREEVTEQAAHVEFSAQDYTPTRDFEVAVELAAQQWPLVIIPHERGEDGYFLMQLTPPGENLGPWKRQLVPENGRLNLLILADTSASMDRRSRQTQLEFITALLSSLGDDDQFNLAGCDVGCTWALNSPLAPVHEANIARVREFLLDRRSLGWSDLDRSFASALKRAQQANQTNQTNHPTHIIYVGDGNVTTTDNDAVAFGNRLQALFAKASSDRIAMHAVAVSSQFESLALQAIAAHGGGSVREIGGERTPSSAAAEFLIEVAQPSIRDLKIQINGFRTAAVYPQQLPNLVPGKQQVILGRYLPTGDDQVGEVVVTGVKDGKPIEFSSSVAIRESQSGNSFIPRLWARMHLDYLLRQGSSPEVKQDIISMSEEFHIITPFTSLLVLESDEDRERFGIKRNYTMRDGEKFFAEGRSQANFELLQAQMRRAGNWRMALQRRFVAALRHWDHTPRAPNNPDHRLSVLDGVNRPVIAGGYGGGFGGGGFGDEKGFFNGYGGESLGRSSRGRGFAGAKIMSHAASSDAVRYEMAQAPAEQSLIGAYDTFGNEELLFERDSIEEEFISFDDDINGDFFAGDEISAPGQDAQQFRSQLLQSKQQAHQSSSSFELQMMVTPRVITEFADRRKLYAAADLESFNFNQAQSRFPNRPQGIQTFLSWIMPDMGAPVRPPQPPANSQWTDEARKLAQSLDRQPSLRAVKGGVWIKRRVRAYHPQTPDELSSDRTRIELVSPTRWLVHDQQYDGSTITDWCNENRRVASKDAFGWSASRQSIPRELLFPPIQLEDGSLRSLESNHTSETPQVERDGDLATIVIGDAQQTQYRYTIDTKRNVLFSVESIAAGERTSLKTFSAFVDVAGREWATRIETLNGKGTRTRLVEQKIRALNPQQVTESWDDLTAHQSDHLTVEYPLMSLAIARKAIESGNAQMGDYLMQLAHFDSIQDWKSASKTLDQLRRSTSAPGIKWLEGAVLFAGRRHEELREWLLSEAKSNAAQQDAAAVEAVEPDQAPAITTVLNQIASQTMSPREQLELHQLHRPVVDRQPAFRRADYAWKNQLAMLLSNDNRALEALTVRKQLAGDYPRDLGAQHGYLQQLISLNQYDEFIDLSKTLPMRDYWSTTDRDYLRSSLIYHWRRWNSRELADWMQTWVADDTRNQEYCEIYLASLVRSDRLRPAETTVANWFRLAADRVQERSPQERARINAAIDYALGDCADLRHRRIEKKWISNLTKSVQELTRSDDTNDWSLANRIVSHRRFKRLEIYATLKRQFLHRLKRKMDTLTIQQINHLTNWIRQGSPSLDTKDWKEVSDKLQDRWQAETDVEIKDQLGSRLAWLLSIHDSPRHLAFLRTRLEQSPERLRAARAGELYGALLGRPWSQEFEDQLFDLLPQITGAPQHTAEHTLAVSSSLMRLTDQMLAKRLQSLQQQQQKDIDEKSRKEQQAIHATNQKLAREGYATRLNEEVAKQSGRWRDWYTLESLYLDHLLNRSHAAMVEFGWKVAGDQPQPPNNELEQRWRAAVDAESLEKVESEIADDDLDAQLRHRGLQILMMQAVGTNGVNGDEAVSKRLLSYFRSGSTAESGKQAKQQQNVWRERWQVWEYNLLVATDQPAELHQRLQSWETGDSPRLQMWQKARAYLLAEQGEILPAIKLLESVEQTRGLSSQDYQMLSNWYLIADQADEHHRSKLARFEMLPENKLHNVINQCQYRWQSDSDVPDDLDPDILLAFQALFSKSRNPGNYVYSLRQLYLACRDFRLLESIPAAVLGHTPDRVYPLLGNLQSNLINDLHEEATTDPILRRLRAVIAKPDRTVLDRRALLLLEMMVERRNAKLLNQPGPHVDRALEAMQQAFAKEWLPGEPRHMADLLRRLGVIEQARLAEEQRRQLAALFEMAPVGGQDRLKIANAWSHVLWHYNQREQALQQLRAAIDERLQHQPEILDNDYRSIRRYTDYLIAAKRHRTAEQFLLSLRQAEQPYAIETQLDESLSLVYRSALTHGGTVSHGTGVEIYSPLEQWLRDQVREVRSQTDRLDWLLSFYRAAHRHVRKQPARLAKVQADFRDWQAGEFLDRLKRYPANYSNTVFNVASCARDLLGSRDALRLLIERLENEPEWLRLDREGGWQRYGYQLAEWRYDLIRETQSLGSEWNRRLLRLVEQELRRDLDSMESVNQSLYHQHHGNRFWKTKKGDFLKVAQDIYNQHRNSPDHVRYIASYVWDGLGERAEAIQMLDDALADNVLDFSGKQNLAEYLFKHGRYQRSSEIYQQLIADNPGHLDLRFRLMRSLAGAGLSDELATVATETEQHLFGKSSTAHFHDFRNFADACYESGLFQKATEYCQRAIDRHAKEHGVHYRGDDSLPNLYLLLARSHHELEQPLPAIDAASAAIVAWGPRKQHREEALSDLRQSMERSDDANTIEAHLDAEAEKTGLENPIVRKAFGQMLMHRRDWPAAIRQLKVAIESQPNDLETHTALISCYQAVGDRPAEIAQTFEMVELNRRDVGAWAKLAERFRANSDAVNQERALTSMVEMLPRETESHTALANHRQQAGQWESAVVHWQRVADLREREPTGLLRLAEAEIHLQRWDDARITLDRLSQRDWPPRFGDVNREACKLRDQIPTN